VCELGARDCNFEKCQTNGAQSTFLLLGSRVLQHFWFPFGLLFGFHSNWTSSQPSTCVGDVRYLVAAGDWDNRLRVILKGVEGDALCEAYWLPVLHRVQPRALPGQTLHESSGFRIILLWKERARLNLAARTGWLAPFRA
jgi:hypothetical protein